MLNVNQFILPEILIAGLACFILLWSSFIPNKYKFTNYWLTQIGLIFNLYIIYNNFRPLSIALSAGDQALKTIYLINDSIVSNQSINFFKLIINFFMILIFIYTKDYLTVKKYYSGEYFVLNLLSMLGMMIVISSSHFLSFYLGIELFSFPIYILTALGSKEINLEAAIKYFVIGAVFSGILLYGLSLIYGASGNLNFHEINNFIQTQNITMLFNTGIVLVFIAIFFKLNLVPMHMWAPDIYQGAPLPVTILLSTLPKITTVIIFGRIITEISPNLIKNYWQILLIVIAILSLLIGNIGAMLQQNLKRLLAYSAVGHAGFILLGFITNTQTGRTAANFYVVLYAFILMGIFAIINLFSKDSLDLEELKYLNGFAKQHSWLGTILLILILAMMGIPPTIMFYAKFLILKDLVDANLLWLAVFAVIVSIISMFYYLKIIKHMFFIESDYAANNYEYLPTKFPLMATVAISINSLLILGLGIAPIFINNIIKYFEF